MPKRPTPQKPNRKGLRQCVGCRGYFVPATLLRLVRQSSTPANPLPAKAPPPLHVVYPAALGLNQKTTTEGVAYNGRSAWCCPTHTCLTTAIKGKQFARALRCPVPEASLLAIQAKITEK